MACGVYKICEVLDATSCKKEQEGIVETLDKNGDAILDLSGCTYVSSAGLRTLLFSYKVAKSKHQNVYLVGVSKEVREVMSITGFERFFKYYDTVDECKKEIG